MVELNPALTLRVAFIIAWLFSGPMWVAEEIHCIVLSRSLWLWQSYNEEGCMYVVLASRVVTHMLFGFFCALWVKAHSALCDMG